jgi:hypothetical protein
MDRSRRDTAPVTTFRDIPRAVPEPQGRETIRQKPAAQGVSTTVDRQAALTALATVNAGRTSLEPTRGPYALSVVGFQLSRPDPHRWTQGDPTLTALS